MPPQTKQLGDLGQPEHSKMSEELLEIKTEMPLASCIPGAISHVSATTESQAVAPGTPDSQADAEQAAAQRDTTTKRKYCHLVDDDYEEPGQPRRRKSLSEWLAEGPVTAIEVPPKMLKKTERVIWTRSTTEEKHATLLHQIKKREFLLDPKAVIELALCLTKEEVFVLSTESKNSLYMFARLHRLKDIQDWTIAAEEDMIKMSIKRRVEIPNPVYYRATKSPFMRVAFDLSNLAKLPVEDLVKPEVRYQLAKLSVKVSGWEAHNCLSSESECGRDLDQQSLTQENSSGMRSEIQTILN